MFTYIPIYLLIMYFIHIYIPIYLLIMHFIHIYIYIHKTHSVPSQLFLDAPPWIHIKNTHIFTHCVFHTYVYTYIRHPLCPLNSFLPLLYIFTYMPIYVLIHIHQTHSVYIHNIHTKHELCNHIKRTIYEYTHIKRTIYIHTTRSVLSQLFLDACALSTFKKKKKVERAQSALYVCIWCVLCVYIHIWCVLCVYIVRVLYVYGAFLGKRDL